MVKSLTLKQQPDLFHRRGIKFNPRNYKDDLHKIHDIGYYRLKEFAWLFSFYTKDNHNKSHLKYNHLSFGKLLFRYKQDKRLRTYVLQAAEDIEVSLDSNIADILGKYKPSGFGYLNFYNWINHNENPKEIAFKKKNFKRKLLNEVRRKRNRHRSSSNYSFGLMDIFSSKNINDGLPSAWLMANLISFDTAYYIFKDMSPDIQNQVSSKYDCSSQQLIDWLYIIKFIRNICAHNSNLIDVRIKHTNPPYMFRSCIVAYINNQSTSYSNVLATAFFLIKYLHLSINDNNIFKHIRKVINAIVDNDPKIARRLGFSNIKAISYLTKTPRELHFGPFINH